MDSIPLLLLLQVALIGLNAVFASAELAVLSINETKLERMAEEGNSRAKRLWRLTREPAKFLSTIQVAITLSGFLGSAFAADNFSEPLVDLVLSLGVDLPRTTLDTAAVILITLILSYFTLIFGELVPKRLAMNRSEQIAMGISGLVSGISVLFKPVVWFLSISTDLVLRLCGVDPNEADEEVSEEEIRMLVDAGGEKGVIDRHEKEFILNVFAFNDTPVRDVATRRTEVDILWLEDDIGVWLETIHRSRHTLYPVCDGSPDKVTGILNAKDFFRLEEQTKEQALAHAVSPAYFVPETVKADVLLRSMQQQRKSLAVIIDEYGGMVGVVTFFDLIEELVGSLEDEPEDPSDPAPGIRRQEDGSWRILGSVELWELEEATGLELTKRDYDTLTGLVFDRLGIIPEDGPQDIRLELTGARLQVLRVEGHQVADSILRMENQE